MTPQESRPTPPNFDWKVEFDRLTTVSSIVDVANRYVSDLTPIPIDNLPRGMRRLAVPPGWHLARLDVEGSLLQPTRIAVYGERPDGSWDGCETISVFGFTGVLPADVVRENADCTLRDLNAERITTNALAAPPAPGVTAVRSRGDFNVGGRHVWAQYSIYVTGSKTPGQGMLIDQGLFIEVALRRQLWNDIEQLGNAIHIPFLNTASAYEATGSGSTPPVHP